MKRLITSVTSILCLSLLSLAAEAHTLAGALATPDCDNQTIKLTFNGFTPTVGEYFVDYTITLDPTDGGPPIIFTDVISDIIIGSGFSIFNTMTTLIIPELAGGSFEVSGSATLIQEGRRYNTAVLTNADGETTFEVNCTSPVASLGDRVWNDLDRDGVQDSGELGIDGVEVQLTDCGIPADVIQTMTTANGGLYLFENLDAGTAYCVEFDEPSAEAALDCDASFSAMDQGNDDSSDSDANSSTGKTDPIILAAGEQNLTVDAGLSCPELGSLGDFVWEDLNADGVQDSNELGINGVTVNLFQTNGQGGACDIFVKDTFTAFNPDTSSDGYYLFDELPKAEYCVQFVKVPSLTCDFGDVAFSTSNGDINVTDNSDAGTDGFTSVIDLGAGEDNPNVDAGLYCPAKLGNFVWEDSNRDGVQDTNEDGLSGVTVNLLACVDGKPTNNVIGTTTTVENGMYMFAGLTPGDYAVEFVAPADYEFSPAYQGDDALDSDAGAMGRSACVTLESNEYDDTVDAGLNQPPAGLGDRLWEDKNADGIQNDGATGISGATVNLYEVVNDSCDTSGTAFATTTTVDDGFYEFLNLDAGKYCVKFLKPQICDFGLPEFTLKGIGDDAGDSDVGSTGQTGIIILAPDQYDPTNDAGIYCPAKIGDTVWKDTDEDGIQDTDELGVDGVQVKLYACDAETGNIVGDSIDMTATSGGMYMFSDLMPGNYRVQFIEPADLDFTVQDAGGDALDSDADSSGFTACTEVGSNEYDDSLDAGLIDPPPCGLGLVKTCEIIAPPPMPLEDCDGKIQSFTMIWTGGTISIDGIANDAGGTVVNGQEVTFSAPIDGWDSNDNFLTISESGAVSGESVFHMSCSDGDMDGETDDPAFPSDCGKPNGDGKDDDADFINGWLFEGLTDASNQVVDCTVPDTVPTSSCEFSATVASCDTLPDKPTMFSFQFTGGGCAAADNSQGSKFECDGAVDANSNVTLMTSAGETIDNVKPGDLVTIEKDGSETTITLDDGSDIETIVFHTSCSAPLITGEVFGSLTLTALDGQGSGKEVLYSYLVSNGGNDVITDILVTDNVFGTVGTVGSLNPGVTETLTAMTFVSETTTNIGTAMGTGSGQCAATAEATVTVLPPPKCSVSVAFKELKDDAIKYTVTNTGNSPASLDEFVLEFPSGFVAIKEVKLDGGIYKSDDSSLVVESGVVILSGDWTEDDVSKRVLDPGEDRTLEIKFEEKFEKAKPGDFDGTVKFNDGDCMIML